MTKFYDFYTEPCQLCIERAESGQFDLVESCGWCNDNDTYHSESAIYPGCLIKIKNGGDGYPFHSTAHANRKYFLSDTHLNQIDGANPIDSSVQTKKSVELPIISTKHILYSFMFVVSIFICKMIFPDFTISKLFALLVGALAIVIFKDRDEFSWGIGLYSSTVLMNMAYINEISWGLLASFSVFFSSVYLLFSLRKLHLFYLIPTALFLGLSLPMLSHIVFDSF